MLRIWAKRMKEDKEMGKGRKEQGRESENTGIEKGEKVVSTKHLIPSQFPEL